MFFPRRKRFATARLDPIAGHCFERFLRSTSVPGPFGDYIT